MLKVINSFLMTNGWSKSIEYVFPLDFIMHNVDGSFLFLGLGDVESNNEH